jgi:type IV secretion system protein VirB11
MELDSHNNRKIHIKAVDGFDEKTSAFILRDFDSLTDSIKAAS